MKHMKEVAVPATTKMVLVETTCDCCGNVIAKRGRIVSDVVISLESGEIYPEFGNITKTSFDMCENCFIDILVPFLKSKNMNPTITKYDY